MSNGYIENIHKKNKQIVTDLNLKVGDKLRLRREYLNFKVGNIVTIGTMHPLYYWILIKESHQFPQTAEDLFKIVEIIGDLKEVKGGIN